MARERRHGARKPPTSSIHAGMRIAHVSGCGPTVPAHFTCAPPARRRRAGDGRRSEAAALLIRSAGGRIMPRIVWQESAAAPRQPRASHPTIPIVSRNGQRSVDRSRQTLVPGRGRAWQPTGGLAASGRWCRDLLSVAVRISVSIGKDVPSCRCGFLVSADADLRSSTGRDLLSGPVHRRPGRRRSCASWSGTASPEKGAKRWIGPQRT
jgi:hypothetical protein